MLIVLRFGIPNSFLAIYLPLYRKIKDIPCHFMKLGPIGLVLVGGANVNIGA